MFLKFLMQLHHLYLEHAVKFLHKQDIGKGYNNAVCKTCTANEYLYRVE
jgi:hypothetical protein